MAGSGLLLNIKRLQHSMAVTIVVVDGSMLDSGNNRGKNFTRAKIQRRRAQLEESDTGDPTEFDAADWQESTEALTLKVTRLTEKLMN